MFHDWENFYLIVGSGAGALIGIMFVVATLMAGFDTAPRVEQGIRVYITPTVFHFSVILVVSAISVVPEITPASVALIVGGCAATGFTYAAMTTIRMFLDKLPNPPDLEDRLFYGVLPTVVYLGLAWASIATWFSMQEAAYAIGAVMLILLLIGIRNAWDLATFMAQRTNERKA